MFWWWTFDYTPEGDLSAVADDDIADAVEWKREPATLVAALCDAGFMDGSSRQVHDWADYAGRWIDRRAANAERKRIARAARGGSGRPPDVLDPSHKSPALPDLTGPDLTGPDLTGPDLTGPDRTEPPPPTPPATVREGGGALPRAHTPRKEKVVLNGRDGWAGCPAGCPTNHGGPVAARHLGEDWLAIPPDDRPAWPEFLTRHGRRDLADVPAPTPVPQEA
jgi:hypothetical protein